MNEYFSPSVWPEDPVPAGIEDCTRCELFKQRARVIWGEGNPKANIMVVLDNPGCREDKDGSAFICGTRQTLQSAANTVGLNEKDLYITYILKCRPVRKYDKEAARTTCLGYLQKQLQTNNFEIVFCLGDAAVKAFFGDPERSVKNTRGILHHIRGFPTCTSYHPLAVRRRPNLYGIFIEDWRQVASMSRNLNLD
ncbi:MAG TPA: uracil-DNA glycosylase [Clostridia bacterium]